MANILFISSSVETKFNPFLNAFKKISPNLKVVYYPGHDVKLIDRIWLKLLCHPAIKQYNYLIRNMINKGIYYDLVVVVKGTYIDTRSYQMIRRNSRFMIYWSNDDISRKHNNSYYLRKSLRFFDRVYTMKILNLIKDELSKFRVQDVEYLLQCYSNELEVDLKSNPRCQFRHDVTFVGSYESKRYKTIKFLADNGVMVSVYGNGWRSNITEQHNNIEFYSPVTGIDYQKTINESKISLCFLRKINEDSVTVRSVEIPAYGGFMIGEYSVEHAYMFKDRAEAIWCKNDMEFLKYVKYYIARSTEREEIAVKGNLRVKALNCSYEEQARYIKDCFLS